MATRLDGLCAGVFPVPVDDSSAVVGERVRAGQIRFSSSEDTRTFGHWEVSVMARVGPFWLVHRKHRGADCGFHYMTEAALCEMHPAGEDDAVVRAYAEAGCLR